MSVHWTGSLPGTNSVKHSMTQEVALSGSELKETQQKINKELISRGHRLAQQAETIAKLQAQCTGDTLVAGQMKGRLRDVARLICWPEAGAAR